MLGQCDTSIDIAAFEEALAAILPRSQRAIRLIALAPDEKGLRVEVRTRDCVGSSVLPRRGPWERRIVTSGPALALLAGKLGVGELKLTYASGRLFLNRLSVPAKEQAP